jgi:hypothetical protein
VSLLFPERVVVKVGASEVSLNGETIPCDPAYGAEPWQGALAAFAAQRFESPCKVTVVLANPLVRYAIVPWSEGLDTPEEEDAYVRHHFAKVYGERARDWELRASEAVGAGPRLASAVDRRLVEELKALFPKSGKAKLVSVQPELMSKFNEWRGFIPAGGAWLVLAEPDRACIALHGRAGWSGVLNGKGAWLELLDRERYRLSEDAPDVVLLAGDKAPASPVHWKFRELAG